ncbi:MAG: COQ9 family protein [Pseudomonadota bacterium]
MTTPSEKLRDRWLEALLPEVEAYGWTMGAAERVAEEVGLSEGERALVAPNGISDLIDHFFDRAADLMLEHLATEDLGKLRTHERVAFGLKTWLEVLEPNKEAVRRAAGRGLVPWGAGAAVKRVWSVADAIWAAAGDTATDYNRQTKRALLSAVIPSVVLHWLDAETPESVDRHIARRLKQAMALGQTGSRVIGPFLDPAEGLRRGRSSRKP